MDKVRRITAWVTILVIVGLIIGMIVCAIMGSDYFFGFLALSIFVPILLWIFMWFTRIIGNGAGDADSVIGEDKVLSDSPSQENQ